MATIYFPESRPSEHKLAALIEDCRKIELAPDHQNEASSWTCQVALGFDAKGGLPQVACFPSHYTEVISAFVWRENAIRLVLQFHTELRVTKLMQDNLGRILQYMDAILCCLAQEAGNVASKDRDPKWRCKVFDSYLAIDFFVGRHEPSMVRNFRRQSDLNIDRVDVAQIGQKSHIFQIMPPLTLMFPSYYRLEGACRQPWRCLVWSPIII